MKTSLLATSSLLGLAAISCAGQLSQDVEASYNASGGARTHVGRGRNADVSSQSTQFQYLLSYATSGAPIIRFGVGYDRYDFGFAGPGFIPDALQSLTLVTGLDLKISDFLIRIEAKPGFYGDNRDFNGGDFNIPFFLGASYLVSKDFQWIAGLSFDANRSNPVMGGIGFRWKTSDRWTVNIVPPNPRVEFKATDDVTLYAGGQIVGSTFRVNENFGNGRRGRSYRSALVDYTEIRTGVGASWKFNPQGTLEVELGYMPYRDFDFHKVGDNYETKSGAIYGQVGIKLGF